MIETIMKLESVEFKSHVRFPDRQSLNNISVENPRQLRFYNMHVDHDRRMIVVSDKEKGVWMVEIPFENCVSWKYVSAPAKKPPAPVPKQEPKPAPLPPPPAETSFADAPESKPKTKSKKLTKEQKEKLGKK